jgi:hypothetical protein
MLQEKDAGTLAGIKARNPAYGSEEYGPVEDITSTYSIKAHAGMSSDVYEGKVKPRRSFEEVCSCHSILSLRKGTASGPDSNEFTNVYAQYSGPDLVHCGWLKKETGNMMFMTIFQSRYAVLTKHDRILRYFLREDDTEPKGQCDLSRVIAISPPSENYRQGENIRDSIGVRASPDKQFSGSGDDGRGKRFTLDSGKGTCSVRVHMCVSGLPILP